MQKILVDNATFKAQYEACKTVHELSKALNVSKHYCWNRMLSLGLPSYSAKFKPEDKKLENPPAFNLSTHVRKLNNKRNALKALDSKKIVLLKDLDAKRANISKDIQELSQTLRLVLGI